jgi:hypothetical protein
MQTVSVPKEKELFTLFISVQLQHSKEKLILKTQKH